MRVAVIGCGVMGSAFARELAKNGHSLILCDRNQKRTELLADEINGEYIEDLSKAAHQADVILLAIKPKDLTALATKIGKLDGQILISMLMGITLESLKKHFPGAISVRSMPNLAVTCGQSVIALVQDPSLPAAIVEKINHLLDGLGFAPWVLEEKIDAITALAGSGPAFVIGMIEAMIESGIKMGLRASEAQELALATVLGSVGMIKQNEGHPGAIRWQICAPGGATIAGMHAFEEEAVRAGIMNTFLAAYKRVKE